LNTIAPVRAYIKVSAAAPIARQPARKGGDFSAGGISGNVEQRLTPTGPIQAGNQEPAHAKRAHFPQR
jgi:hypothetical protein